MKTPSSLALRAAGTPWPSTESMIVSWPTNATGFTLQSTPNLPKNLVAADVSPLHLNSRSSQSRLTSATVQGFKARILRGNLTPPVTWLDVTNPPTVLGGLITVTNPISGAAEFLPAEEAVNRSNHPERMAKRFDCLFHAVN